MHSYNEDVLKKELWASFYLITLPRETYSRPLRPQVQVLAFRLKARLASVISDNLFLFHTAAPSCQYPGYFSILISSE